MYYQSLNHVQHFWCPLCNLFFTDVITDIRMPQPPVQKMGEICSYLKVAFFGLNTTIKLQT